MNIHFLNNKNVKEKRVKMNDEVGICNFCGNPINLTEEKKFVVTDPNESELFWLCLNCKELNADKEISKILDLSELAKFREQNRWK